MMGDPDSEDITKTGFSDSLVDSSGFRCSVKLHLPIYKQPDLTSPIWLRILCSYEH